MSYDSIEESTDLSRPLFFYEFIYDDAPGSAYRYVADAQQRIAGGRTWRPFPAKHSEISVSGSLDKQAITVTLRKDTELTAMFIVGPPSRVVRLNIWRGHLDESEIVMEWTGRILNCKWAGPEVEFSCEPISTSMMQVGLRRKYQRGCPFTLYGKSCGASQLAHTEKGYVVAVNGPLQVVVQMNSATAGLTFPNLIGGIFRVTLDNGITEIRSVTWAAASGNRQWILNLISQIPEMRAGLNVSLSKGCGHTFEICRDTFGNAANYGGCPNIPTKDPFRANQF